MNRKYKSNHKNMTWGKSRKKRIIEKKDVHIDRFEIGLV